MGVGAGHNPRAIHQGRQRRLHQGRPRHPQIARPTNRLSPLDPAPAEDGAGRKKRPQVTTSSTILTDPVPPKALLEFIEPGADLIMPNANGEPVKLVDTLEEHADELQGVRIHQMHALRERRCINGEFGDRLRHVSYFLAPATRKAYQAGKCELMPNHFSEVPELLRRHTKCSMVIAAASPPNRHGYFSLGTALGFTASLIGRVPFFLESN